MTTVKIKLLKGGIMPVKATEGAAAYDCFVYDGIEEVCYETHVIIKCPLGFCIEIPKGYVGYLMPRSSIYKTPFQLANSVGVIDSDYRGEVVACFRLSYKAIISGEEFYNIGERCCQLIIMELPSIELEIVSELSETLRADGGFGSTGK